MASLLQSEDSVDVRTEKKAVKMILTTTKKRKHPEEPAVATDATAAEKKRREARAKRIARSGVVSAQEREDIEREEAGSNEDGEWIDGEDEDEEGNDEANDGTGNDNAYDVSDPFFDDDDDADDAVVLSAFGRTIESASEHAVDRLEDLVSSRTKQRLVHQRDDQNANERFARNLRALLSDFMATCARIVRDGQCEACRAKRARIAADLEEEEEEEEEEED